MLNWKTFDQKTLPESGQYIVHCVAPQFDSEWIDIARFDNGEWHKFGCPVSHHLRVRHYSEINYPNV